VVRATFIVERGICCTEEHRSAYSNLEFHFTAIEKKGKGFLNNLELRGGKLNVKTYLTKSLGSEAPFLLGEVDTKQPK
jgi:hypothetical protein